MSINKKRFLGLFILLIWATQSMAWVPERRPQTGDDKLGWLVAPMPIRMEGVGQAINFFGLVSNFYEKTDLIILKTLPGGDFDFGGGFIDDLPLYKQYLQFTGGVFRGLASLQSFARGIDSDREDFVLPLFEQNATFYEFTSYFWEERIRLFYQVFTGKSLTTKILDKDGNEISSQESESNFEGKNYGGLLDFTDDPLDPRKGIIFGQKYRPVLGNDLDRSDILVTDTGFTGFVPMFESDTLVFDLFLSTSSIIRKGVTDEATARSILNQNCDSSSTFYAACKSVEDKLVSEFLAYNRYGNATSLGGTNRMRSYPNSRFYAGNTSFMGIEYRYNFSSEQKPINWYLLGGVETLLQLAFFYEQGTVAEHTSELNQNMKSSYGVGARAIISGFVYRLDLAMGEEGPGITIFFDYPMKLLPITG